MADVTLNLGRANSDKQLAFLKSKTKYTAYGGARGGGKSWVARYKAVLGAIRYNGIKILIVRRTFPELRENHILPLRMTLGDVAKYTDNEKAFLFPNGSRIKLGYCAVDADLTQYQGQEYDWIFIDEATQLTEFQFVTFRACLRGINDIPKRMYLTCNPGGVGHVWVKRLFIDKDYKDVEDPAEYSFIPAKVYDNKDLMKTNPDYVKNLESLPEGLREAWLNGSWDAFAGQYFREFDRDIHVVDPFVIPPNWNRYRAMDYGFDMLACLWIAVNPQGEAFVYKELNEKDLVISDAAKRIKEVNNGDVILQTFAPPDMWNRRQDTGRSLFDIFLVDNGIVLSRAKNQRVSGWYAVKEFLKIISKKDEQTGENIATSKLKIFSNCINLIKCIPQLQHDEKDPNDCATEPHSITHSTDALRYFCTMRQLIPSAAEDRPIEDGDGIDRSRWRRNDEETSYLSVLGGKIPQALL